MLGEATLDALGTFLGEAIRCEGVFVALDHLRRAQSTFAALQLDLPVDHRRGPGLAKRLDQSGNPRMPGDQPGFQLNVDLEIQPIRHSRPPHPAGETYHPARTKAESTTSMQTLANPRSLAGVRGSRSALDGAGKMLVVLGMKRSVCYAVLVSIAAASPVSAQTSATPAATPNGIV